MERRLLLVFALTFLVIVLFQPLLKKYYPQPTAPPSQAQPQTQPQIQAPAPPASPLANAAAAAPPRSKRAGAVATKQASTESEITIENDLYRVTFTNRGGQVKSWILKKFKDDKGAPLELVNKAASERYGYPLSLWTYDEALRNQLNLGALPSLVFGDVDRPGGNHFRVRKSGSRGSQGLSFRSYLRGAGRDFGHFPRQSRPRLSRLAGRFWG